MSKNKYMVWWEENDYGYGEDARSKQFSTIQKAEEYAASLVNNGTTSQAWVTQVLAVVNPRATIERY